MGGGYKSVLKNRDNTDFDLAEDSKRKESIDQANFLELVSNKVEKAPYPVLTFEVRNDRNTLIKTETKAGGYKIINTTGRDYEKWGYSDSLFESFENETYDIINEGSEITINKPTYIYAIFKLEETKKNINVKYEFERVDQENQYEKDTEFAELEKSIISHNSKKGDKISITKFDIYAPDRDERLKLLNPTEWDTHSVIYEKKPEVVYTSTKKTQEKKTEANIIDDGSTNYTVIFRYKRKRVVVQFVMPDGSNPSTIPDQTIMFGAKMRPITTSLRYTQSDWDSKTYSELKCFSEQMPDYTNNYSENKPKFDIENHVFGETDFATPTKTLYPVWERATNVTINLQVYGQDTTGEGYNSDYKVYRSDLKKKDGDKVKVDDVLNFVKSKIDENVYDKENITFKQDGNDITQFEDIDVELPGISIEFRVNRKIRTITLNTDKTVDVSNVVGALEITNNNKTLKFRHGYQFKNDEKPIIPEDENDEDEFLGWQKNSVDFEFNVYEVTENITLTAKLKKKDARVVVNLNGLRGDGLKYIDESITASPDATYSKITFQIPYEMFNGSPYLIFDTCRLTNPLNSQ